MPRTKLVLRLCFACSWILLGRPSIAETPPHPSETSPVLRLDLNTLQAHEARNFRSMNDPFQRSSTSTPSLQGLESLRASGSGQPTRETFQKLRGLAGTSRLVDVDLRQESHGFAGDVPVSWYAPHDWINRGKDLKQVETDERSRLETLRKDGKATAYAVRHVQEQDELTPYSLTVNSVSEEASIAKQSGAEYFRIAVTDHLPPTDVDVESFLKFYRSLPKDVWLHFHCEAGEGRTTTFLAMTDMLHNAREVSFEDILQRQYLLGGADLSKHPAKDAWQYQGFAERTAFLRRFYDYARSGSKLGWSEWIEKYSR